MEMERAKEIFASKEFIPVTYEGFYVHIDRLFESTPFAQVSYENGAVTNVDIAQLREAGVYGSH